MLKKSCKILISLICIMNLVLPHFSVVLAAALTNDPTVDARKINLTAVAYHEGGEESTGSLSGGYLDRYDERPNKYTAKGTPDSTDILKILREDDKEVDDDGDEYYAYSDAFYCLDGNNGFPTISGATEYTRTIDNLFAGEPETFNFTNPNIGNYYNSLCWILHNMYLRKQLSVADRTAYKNTLLEKAFHDLLEEPTEDGTTLNDIKATLTDDDIEVVQQWAIWYFTNNGEKTLQDVPFVRQDSDNKYILPDMDLTYATPSGTVTNSVPDTRYKFMTILYQYLVNQGIANKDNEHIIPTYPRISYKSIACVIDGDNYKVGPFRVAAPSTGITTSQYRLVLTDGENEIPTDKYIIKNEQGETITDNINVIFDTEYFIYLPIAGNTYNTVKLELSYTKYDTVASVWQASDDHQPVTLVTKKPVNFNDSASASIIEGIKDLALRKYIIAVNGKEVTDREPTMSPTVYSVARPTTLEYKHKKEPIEVSKNDTVTYRIKVYNEGNIAAKVTKIVDYLPEGLELVSGNSTNDKWSKETDGTYVTDALAGTVVKAREDTSVYSAYVDMVCKVTANVGTDPLVLTNIAEIAEAKDTSGNNLGDRDSHPRSIKIEDIENIPGYIGSSGKTDLTDAEYYYYGFEDDDDFEKVKVKAKTFDLNLKKFITKVNGKDVSTSREPKVNVQPLKDGGKNATYTLVKNPVTVNVGDKVTYKIRVYNEGTLGGYAESIADYIPEGLGYLVEYGENIDNCWSYSEEGLQTTTLGKITNGTKNLKIDQFRGVTDLANVSVVKGSKKLTSNLLSSGMGTSKLIPGYDMTSSTLPHQDIEITCVVLSDANLKNIAEIANDKDENKRDVTDRDSTPDTVDPTNYPSDDEKKQDDHDIEYLTIGNFDLALQKFITKLDNKEIKDREPKIEYNSGKITYSHPTTPLDVENGNNVEYTIRVYNEGDTDGYAAEIADDIPEGLEFDPTIETNKIWTMYDKDGKVTTEAKDAKTIKTDYLSKTKGNARGEDTLLKAFDLSTGTLRYLDVKAVFKVNCTKTGTSIINTAEISKDTDADENDIDDRDSIPGNGKEGEDDIDKERIIVKEFDLALQKFITKLNDTKITDREPKISYNNGKITYSHISTPLGVKSGDKVTYTIRVYNEGDVDGYAKEVSDNIPNGLIFDQSDETNKKYDWAMYDKDGKVTTNPSNAVAIKTDYLSKTKGEARKEETLIKAFDSKTSKLSFVDVQVVFTVSSSATSDMITNIAEITDDSDKDGNPIDDRDSTPDNKKDGEDDIDKENVQLGNFDLSLQKFISNLNDKEIKDRVPKVTYSNKTITYSHPSTPLEVNTGDTVVYTIRVYNEGDVDGYAAEVADDIPSGLVFDTSNSINKTYGWKMYNKSGNETNSAADAVEIRTDYLSKEKAEERKADTLLKAFNSENGTLYYFDVKVAFVVSSTSKDATITNIAEITKDTDKNGNDITDMDSTPNNKKDGEDDIDKENIHVGFFDLSLKKDLNKAIVTVNDSTQEIPSKNGGLVKVEVHRKNINSTIVKFVYDISIKNEGTIPGYATGIKDYIPAGLEFVAADNTADWKVVSDGVIEYSGLAKTEIKPDETKTFQVVLRWINGDNNFGSKVNVAEISSDNNDANDVDDVDSTPDNKKDGEDDIDSAEVLLSISTGIEKNHLILTFIVLSTVATGIIIVKRRF